METAAYNNTYKGYGIEVFLRDLGDGKFNAYGIIRHVVRPFPPANDLPFTCMFDTDGERHPSKDAAIRAGIGFAKKKIDGVW
jgi:hypothetical protein